MIRLKGAVVAMTVVALAGAMMIAAKPAQGKILCVSASRAYLRSGPGTRFKPPTWTVHRYMPLKEIKRQDGWIKVRDVDGEIHWIKSTLVTDKIKCVTIKSFRANIRSRPKTDSRVWFKVEKYTSFELLGKIPKWVKLNYHGEVMWVFHTLVWP